MTYHILVDAVAPASVQKKHWGLIVWENEERLLLLVASLQLSLVSREHDCAAC